MKRFLFWTTYLAPALILSACWILWQTGKDLIRSYYDWVTSGYED